MRVLACGRKNHKLHYDVTEQFLRAIIMFLRFLIYGLEGEVFICEISGKVHVKRLVLMSQNTSKGCHYMLFLLGTCTLVVLVCSSCMIPCLYTRVCVLVQLLGSRHCLINKQPESLYSLWFVMPHETLGKYKGCIT